MQITVYAHKVRVTVIWQNIIKTTNRYSKIYFVLANIKKNS
jgi:hypothetical protein